jgi:predicted transcriptional regulator
MSSTTMTVRLPTEARDKLARLAEHTNRSLSFLAGQAIADYAERELEIVEGIERGLDDAKAGRVVPHDEAMRRLDEAIGRASKE